MKQAGSHALKKNYGSAGVIRGSTKPSTREAVAGPLPTSIDVSAIRLSIACRPYAVTQAEFAQRFGFSPGAVRDWEQGRRKPDGAARMLLSLIRQDHAAKEAVIRNILAAGSTGAAAGRDPKPTCGYPNT